MKKLLLSLGLALTLSCTSVPVIASTTGQVEETKVEINVGNDEEIVTIEEATVDEAAPTSAVMSKAQKNEMIKETDGTGLGVTVMAMCIVLLALIVLSILFMFFGKLFARKQRTKKMEATGAIANEEDDDDHDSGEVIAAIAVALDEHFNSKHDLEDTVLTIRRMKRAYSPWNSKIYNLREVPELRRNRR